MNDPPPPKVHIYQLLRNEKNVEHMQMDEHGSAQQRKLISTIRREIHTHPRLGGGANNTH